MAIGVNMKNLLCYSINQLLQITISAWSGQSISNMTVEAGLLRQTVGESGNGLHLVIQLSDDYHVFGLF
jgi:hypothetical protein